METLIYMPLLGEGTNCWRPVRAVQTADDIFEIIDQLAEGESWAFAPDSRVRCRNHVFTNGEPGLVVFEYAVESNPHYQLLKKHERKVFRVTFTDGEEAVVKILHVDGQHEEFVYDLISSSLDREHYRPRKENAYAARFTDLVSARLEN